MWSLDGTNSSYSSGMYTLYPSCMYDRYYKAGLVDELDVQLTKMSFGDSVA